MYLILKIELYIKEFFFFDNKLSGGTTSVVVVYVIKESQFTYLYYTEDMRGFKIWFAPCWRGSVRRGPRQTGRLGILMNRVAFPERMIYVIFG